MTKDNGGPAFPVVCMNNVWSHGMTMRDWFAGMALQGIIAKHGIAESAWQSIAPDKNAELAYKMADAMLEERKK